MGNELTAAEIKALLGKEGEDISDKGFQNIANRLAQPDEDSAVDKALALLDDPEGYTPAPGVEEIED